LLGMAVPAQVIPTAGGSPSTPSAVALETNNINNRMKIKQVRVRETTTGR